MGEKTSINGLDQVDMQILTYLRDNPTARQADVARAIGLSDTAVSKRYRKPALQDAITDVIGTLEDLLRTAKQTAARKIRRLVLSKDERVALQACKTLLAGELGNPDQSQASPIRFVTVVNEVGVLESRPAEVIEAERSANTCQPNKEETEPG